MEIPFYKKAYPFRLGTTSFIFPAGYVSNVRRLAPCLDEVELLLFESNPADRLPSPEVIRQLAEIAAANDLRYNIHLPTDLFLGSQSREVRRMAVDTLTRVRQRTAVLAPTSSTLHLAMEPSDGKDRTSIRHWQDRVYESLTHLEQNGCDLATISVETLDYPFGLVTDIVENMGLCVCLDMGHLIRYGYDLKQAIEQYAPRTTVVHLHGVRDGQDHLPLDQMADRFMQPVVDFLKTFRHTVSLEVFSLENLNRSLRHLESFWKDTGP